MHILPFSLCLSVPPPPYALCCAFAICALSCFCQLPQITSFLKIFSAVTLFISFSAATTIPAPPARVHHLYFAQNSGRMLCLRFTPVSFTKWWEPVQFHRMNKNVVVCAAKGPRPRYPRVWKTRRKIGTISKSIKLVECVSSLCLSRM
nr:uncharacterized protein LOC113732698 [Coffea arabica]